MARRIRRSWGSFKAKPRHAFQPKVKSSQFNHLSERHSTSVPSLVLRLPALESIVLAMPHHTSNWASQGQSHNI
jgi:hypothetical protein